MDGQHRLEPLGVRGVDDSPALDVALQDGHQRHQGLGRQGPHRVVYQDAVRSVQHRVEDPGVVTVQPLHQQLGQRVRLGRVGGLRGGGEKR